MRVTAPAQSIEFSNTSFSINPGLRGVFAWLSQNAANYDEYELEHLVFHYQPVISQASTSGAMGSILLGCNYNAGASKFKSFREMAEYSGSLETRVCDEAMFGVECDPTKHGSQAIEYIRTGAVPSGQDIKTYDLGLFQIATADVSTFTEGTLLGHLYVEYSVVLGKPKLHTALGKGILQDMYRSGDSVSVAKPFGTSRAIHPKNSLGCTISDTGKITFPDNFYGRVLINYYPFGTNIIFDDPVFTIGGNVDKVYIMGQNGDASYELTSPGSKVNMACCVDVTTASGGTRTSIEFNLTAGVAMWGMNLDIIQVNPDFDRVGW
jgi:hypothetical protein